MILDNLDQSDWERLVARVEKLEASAGTSSASVTRGRFRIASIDGLVVEGQERVTGVLVVDGTLSVSGTQSVSGTLIVGGGQIINGTFRINGTTTIAGNTAVTGDMDITGTVNIEGVLNITGAGRIQAGAVVIDGTSGGRVAAPGATLALVGNQVTVTGALEINNGALIDGPVVMLGSLGVSGVLEVDGMPTTSNTPNVYYNPSNGRFYYVP